MTTHDIDIELPPLPTPPSLIQRKDWYGAIQAYARSYGMECARAAIEAYRKQQFENGVALQRYKECGGDEESDPVERLRFYCSLAMSGQDWLDVEPFFDALLADRKTSLQSQDREDAERLDWLIEHINDIDIDEGHRGWFILERGTSNYITEDNKTAREAIDHARRVEGERDARALD